MYLEPISREQRLKALAKLNATEESIKNDVQYLKQWMEKQPHLPDVSDEKFIVSLLMQSKNSVEKTKAQIEKYYTARALLPEFYSDRDPCQPWFRDFLNTCVHIPLPKLTPEGRRIYVSRFFPRRSVELEGFTSQTYLKGCLMVTDLFVKEDFTHEIIVISDVVDMILAQLTIVTGCMRQYINLIQNTLKCRPHKVYVVNLHPAAVPLIALAKRFMSKKLHDRVVVWDKKPEDLVEELPKDVLPVEYGGNLKSILELRDDYYDYICGFREWFLSEENLKTDISKIPKNNVASDLLACLYGAEGSFRKLCVD